jgi:hypothetical protein
MLEPRMVAARIQGPARALQGAPAFTDRTAASSHGGFMEFVDAHASKRSFEIVHNARKLKVCGAWPRLYHRIRIDATPNSDCAIKAKLFHMFLGNRTDCLASVDKFA